jgi:hypothetical protein
MWAYSTLTKQWAWIAGASTANTEAVSTAPGTELQTPGYSQGCFGKSIEGDLWFLGDGSSATYWLWKFNSKTWLWSTISQINLPDRPIIRRGGKIQPIGQNHIILHSGFNISTLAYRFQDIWSYNIRDDFWNLLSGPRYSGRFNVFPIRSGRNVPSVGGNTASFELHGVLGAGSFSWKRSVFIYGGWTDRTINLALKYTLCDSNEFFNGSHCNVCPIGSRPSDEFKGALDSCEVLCEPGSVLDSESSSFQNCTIGRYSNQEFQSCLPCPKGYYSNQTYRNLECLPCSFGSFNPVEGASYCSNCSSGYYSPNQGSTSCLTCNSGSFSGSNAKECEWCPVGKYSSFLSERSDCIGCGIGATTLEKGSFSSASCICMPGYYGQPYDEIECTKCAESSFVKCERNSSFPALSEGYYRYRLNPNTALECIPSSACLPTSSDDFETKCAEGYTGSICSSCIPLEFYKIGIRCAACPSLVSKVLSFIAVVAALLFLLYQLLRVRQFSSFFDLKVFIFWIQILALYPQLSNSWPSSLAKFFQALSFANLDVEITSPGIIFFFHLFFHFSYFYSRVFISIWILGKVLLQVVLSNFFNDCISFELEI